MPTREAIQAVTTKLRGSHNPLHFDKILEGINALNKPRVTAAQIHAMLAHNELVDQIKAEIRPKIGGNMM